MPRRIRCGPGPCDSRSIRWASTPASRSTWSADMTVIDATALLDLARGDVERERVPACQLALARDGEVVLFESFGDATNATRFHAFSATKPIVSSAIWLLMGEGVLDVTRPVSRYVPELSSDGMGAVTVEQILLHTAGFPNAPMAPADGAD